MEPLDFKDFSAPKKRSISINGHLTSITLEDCFWKMLNQYSADHNIPIAQIITRLDDIRSVNPQSNISLSSMVRQFLVNFYNRIDV